MAVDDGTSTTVRAWRVKPGQYAVLEQYQAVTASVTRYLGYVHSITPVPEQRMSAVASGDLARE